MNSTLEDVNVNAEALRTLQYFGENVRSPVVLVVMSSFLFGLLTTVSVAAMYFLFRKGLRLHSVKILIVGTLILYVSTALYWSSIVMCSLSTSEILQRSAGKLYSGSEHFTDPVDKGSPGLAVQSKILTTSLAANIIVGDAIVWWRACVVWRSRVMYGIGLVLLITTLAFGIAATNNSPLHSLVTPNLLFADMYGIIAGAFSFTTNILSTSLIGYKAWKHRLLLRRHLGESGSRTRALKVLALLVESGMIYSTLWMVAMTYEVHAILHITSGKAFWDVMFYFDYGCLIPAIAMYPTVIIILIALNRSEIESGLVLSISLPIDAESPLASITVTTATDSVVSGSDNIMSASLILLKRLTTRKDFTLLHSAQTSECSVEGKHSETV